MLDPINLTIDTIQNGKKQFINKYITNPILKKSWTDYVTKQSDFLHAAVETNLEVITESTKTLMNTKIEKAFNPFSIDWFQAGWDAYTHNNKH
jgi:uncharacterized protein with HEPN domain